MQPTHLKAQFSGNELESAYVQFSLLAFALTLGIIFFPVSSEIISGTLVAEHHVESKNPPYKGVCLVRLDSGKEISLPCVPQGRKKGDEVRISVEARFIVPWQRMTVLPTQGADI